MMKKTVIILCILTMLIMSACSGGTKPGNGDAVRNDLADSAPVNQTVSDTDNQSKPEENKLNNSGVANEPADSSAPRMLPMTALINGFGTDDGYYYIQNHLEKDGEMYGNIRYMDYETLQDIVLCAKPECSHDDASCQAYLDYEDSQSAIFVAKDKLYLMTTGQFSSYSTDSSDFGQPAALYEMQLDGSNKRKVFEEESGLSLDGFPLLLMDGRLYFTLDKTEMVPMDEAGTSFMAAASEKRIVGYDPESGEKILDQAISTDTHLTGGYNGHLILDSYKYDKDYTDEEMYDWDTFKQIMSKSTRLIQKMNILSGEMTDIHELTYTEGMYLNVWQNQLIYLADGGNSLAAIDLDHGEQKVLAEGISADYIEGIVDNYLILLNDWNDSRECYTKFTMADLSTGELHQLDMFGDKSGHYIEPIEVAGERFLVIEDYVMKTEYIDWADVYQTSIDSCKHALIAKEDLLASVKNYQSIATVN